MDFNLDQNIMEVFMGEGRCDDIAAYELYGPAAIPTVPTWGMVALTLLMLTAGTLVYGRRRPIQA